MKKNVILMITLIFSFTSTVILAATNKSKKPEIIVTDYHSDFYVSDAAFFSSDSHQAVVFVPGFIFNKESWFKLAKPLQKKGIASLAISGKSISNVKAGIEFLKNKGFKDIYLVGGSSGAAAILNTLDSNVQGITKVVTLSAVHGAPILDNNIRKLFIVSKEEKSYQTVQKFYDKSTEPKSLKVFDGRKHAQFLLFGPNKDEVTQLIIDFLVNK